MKTTRIAKKQTNIHYDQNVFMKLFVHAIFEVIKCYITFQSEIYTKINQKDSVVLHINRLGVRSVFLKESFCNDNFND